MISQELIDRIAREFDADARFIGQARNRVFDREALERLLAALGDCPPLDGPVPVELVRLLWWMPWITEWQVQALTETDEVNASIASANSMLFREIERIVGYP